mmetsp:Transcript_18497/g.17819  ORF Transcript_18497/g.17819 Transcript_18497/m.17819 type:complete len:157 (-) Transcript_18497:144-614(-)
MTMLMTMSRSDKNSRRCVWRSFAFVPLMLFLWISCCWCKSFTASAFVVPRPVMTSRTIVTVDNNNANDNNNNMKLMFGNSYSVFVSSSHSRVHNNMVKNNKNSRNKKGKKDEKEVLQEMPPMSTLILAFFNPLRNPNSIFIYMILIINILAKFKQD